MTRLRVCCPQCGAEPMLLPAAVRVLVVGERDDVRAGSAYHFTCPACGTRVVRDADRRVVALLESAGCRVTCSGVEDWTRTAWVGRLDCGHDAAGLSGVPPDPGAPLDCDPCHRTRELVDVVVGRKVTA